MIVRYEGVIIDKADSGVGEDGKGHGILVSKDGDCLAVKNCIIDLGNEDPAKVDEVLSVTRGASAQIDYTTISGGAKLVLLGCGDKEWELLEKDKYVIFYRCILQNGCRRFPEVQSGMICVMYNCTIRNWGLKSFWDTRAFGAWAHHGGVIMMHNCHFEQGSFWQTGFLNFFKDLANHIGQAINDRGLFGLRLKDFIPGVCRGAIATDGGRVMLNNCTANKWWIYLENNTVKR